MIYRLIGRVNEDGFEIKKIKWDSESRTTTIRVQYEDVTRIIKKKELLVCNCDFDFLTNNILAMVWCLPEDLNEATKLLELKISRSIESMHRKMDKM
jgi:hypothetical protein